MATCGSETKGKQRKGKERKGQRQQLEAKLVMINNSIPTADATQEAALSNFSGSTYTVSQQDPAAAFDCFIMLQPRPSSAN